jgi:hypothetical protein
LRIIDSYSDLDTEAVRPSQRVAPRDGAALFERRKGSMEAWLHDVGFNAPRYGVVQSSHKKGARWGRLFMDCDRVDDPCQMSSRQKPDCEAADP